MTKTAKEFVSEAQALVERLEPEEAIRRIEAGEGVVLDVREPGELAEGRVKGALHVPRGLLEFKADPEDDRHEAALEKSKPVYLYCASGGRAALAGKVLLEMGYSEVYNIGGFKGWAEAGGAVETG